MVQTSPEKSSIETEVNRKKIELKRNKQAEGEGVVDYHEKIPSFSNILEART